MLRKQCSQSFLCLLQEKSPRWTKKSENTYEKLLVQFWFVSRAVLQTGRRERYAVLADLTYVYSNLFGHCLLLNNQSLLLH